MFTIIVQVVVLFLSTSLFQQPRFPVPMPEDDLGEVSRRPTFYASGSTSLLYFAIKHWATFAVRRNVRRMQRHPGKVEQVSQLALLNYQMAGR